MFRLRIGLLDGFGLVPEVVLVVEGKADEIKAALAGEGLHAFKAGKEAFRGGVQGGGRLDPLAAAKFDEGEHMVAELVFDGLGVVGSHRIEQFQPFSLNLLFDVGVNGVGKTTSIGKLADQLKSDGKRVILAAADTFRAAAIEQLSEWADRAGVDLIAQKEGSDPAAVIYDAIAAAKSRNADVLICDTAGRLHNKKNLMEELKKINRIIDKEYPEAYRETLVVLDGTTGQNALVQARQFMEAAPITGIILTKLDGTAKGGIAVAIQSELGIPVKYVGVGEKIDDLQKFSSGDFVNALFQSDTRNKGE